VHECKPLDGGQVRIGEHTDFGMLTLLFHDSAASGEGLQVKSVEGGAVGGGAGGERGGWLDARGRGGSTAIVNTGYGPTRVAHHSIDAHFTIYS
jgi:isopenicillin N synthase-like dioxygenase